MKQITSSAMLIRKLKQLLVRQRLVLFASGAFATAAATVLASIALSLLASLVILPVALKLTLLVASGLSALIVFGKLAAGRLFDGNVDSVAVNLEGKYPRLKGRLIAAVQFARMKKTPGYSGDLMALTEKQALKIAGTIDFNEAVRWHPLFRTGRYFAATAFVAVALLLLIPGLFSHSFEVYSHPTRVIAPPLGYRVVPFPGSVEWVKYRDIEIGAAIIGDRLPRNATIRYRLVGGSWQESQVDLQGGRRYATAHGDSLSLSITLRQINKSFDYYVEAGRVKTRVQKVDVVDRPRVTGIKLSLIYPDYTGLPPTVIDENNGSFSAVVGTRVNMKIRTNLPVETAQLIFSDSSRTPLEVTGNEAKQSLVVEESGAYYIRLLDHLGETNPDPIEYYITSIPDEYPSIDIVRPDFDVNLNDEMILPLKVHIFDDYGFSSLVLKYTVFSQGRPSDENVAVLHFSERIKTEGEIEFNWDMDQLNLFPGDYVSYCLEVADNDGISGPKITRSRQFVARLPSLDEIVAQAEAESARRISRTEGLLKSGKELARRLKNVARKLQAQSRDMKVADWQQQKEMESIAEKNAELLEDIEKMAEQMERSVDELNEKALMSREILEKLAQIQKLFEEIATPEMRDAQRRLMEALRSMDPEDLQDALQNYQMSQEELLERLERTLALLKRIQLEQMMEAMIRRAEELAKRQENMNEQADSLSKDGLPALSDKETEIRDDLLGLKRDLSELGEMARAARMDDSPEIETFKQAVETTDADQDMQRMSQAMNRQQKNETSKQGKQALTKLLEMLDTMQQQMLALKGGQQDAVEKAMRVAIEDANYLSRNQEGLLKEAASVSRQSLLLRDMALAQQDLANACDGLKSRIKELGKQSPFLAAELQQLVNGATLHMELATEGFDAARGTDVLRSQREAMVQLNRAALRLMESLQQLKQCNKGGQCDKNTSDLQSLCNKQNLLNQQTFGQCNNPGQGLNLDGGEGMQNRQALKRLAAEQGSIRKSLEELNREFGGSRQILGRLEDIAREMREVEEALESGEIGQGTIERQVKIYSRMLEASRSLYRKDFSEKRKSKTATDAAFYVPPELSPELLKDKIKLEDRLRQYLGDNYPPQYEEQIKAYFKALLQIEADLLKQNNADSKGVPSRE